MKKIVLTLTLFSLLFLMSCKQNTTDSNSPDSETLAAIESVLADSSDLFFEGIDDGSEDNIDNDNPNWLGTSLAKSSGFTRFHYGRIATHPVERNIQIELDEGDTTATAYVYTKVKGRFVVHSFSLDSSGIEMKKFIKPMVHEIQRIVHLKKVSDTGVPRQDWRIVDISMRYGASPNNTVEIVSLDIMPESGDTLTITDPLSYYLNGQNVFTYPRHTKIKLRVKVQNTTANPVIYPEGTQATETVRLIYGRNRIGHFARKAFEWKGQDENGYNIYEGTWTIQQFRGWHHAIIDVVDNGTILDSNEETYPYNSVTWDTPYRVTPF